MDNLLANRYISETIKQRLQDVVSSSNTQTRSTYLDHTARNVHNVCSQYKCRLKVETSQERINRSIDYIGPYYYKDIIPNADNQVADVRSNPRNETKDAGDDNDYITYLNQSPLKSNTENDEFLDYDLENDSKIEENISTNDREDVNGADFNYDSRFPNYPHFPAFPQFPEFPEGPNL